MLSFINTQLSKRKSAILVVTITVLSLVGLRWIAAFEAHHIAVTATVITQNTQQDCQSLQIRSKGYWANHILRPEHQPFQPQTLGDEIVTTAEEAQQILQQNDDASSMRNKLKAQLVAMKLNIAYFNIGHIKDENYLNKTLNEIVAEVDQLLKTDNNASNLETMKNLLDTWNNKETIMYCVDKVEVTENIDLNNNTAPQQAMSLPVIAPEEPVADELVTAPSLPPTTTEGDNNQTLKPETEQKPESEQKSDTDNANNEEETQPITDSTLNNADDKNPKNSIATPLPPVTENSENTNTLNDKTDNANNNMAVNPENVANETSEYKTDSITTTSSPAQTATTEQVTTSAENTITENQ